MGKRETHYELNSPALSPINNARRSWDDNASPSMGMLPKSPSWLNEINRPENYPKNSSVSNNQEGVYDVKGNKKRVEGFEGSDEKDLVECDPDRSLVIDPLPGEGADPLTQSPTAVTTTTAEPGTHASVDGEVDGEVTAGARGPPPPDPHMPSEDE